MHLLARRVTDENVQTAEFIHGIIDELHTEHFVAQIARDQHALAARIRDELEDLLRVRLFIRKIIDGDIGAFPGVGNGGRAAHAGIAARDQRLATR